MNNIARIGILGGSFNPVHLGHVSIAETACARFDLDKVLFVPCKVSPFKVGSGPEGDVDDSDRVKMLELSVAGNRRFEISDLELRRGGVSYTYDTVCAVKAQYPDARIYFILGSDSLQGLDKWYKIESLLNMCIFVTVKRPGFKEMPCGEFGFTPEVTKRLRRHSVSGQLLDISSS